ncbi:MAG: hypothetical protein AB7F89_01400 [Pirellulaceae bacterium]
MRYLLLALATAGLPSWWSIGAERPAQLMTTTGGIVFGIWPDKPPRPAPTLFVLAASISETLESAYFRQAGEMLAREGWMLVSVDLPCHGREVRTGESAGLSGWRSRVDRGEDVMADVTQRLRGVLDYLLMERLADPARIAALGTSRGGFAALHFAATDPRVACVAGFAPVTDLAHLSEFRGAAELALVGQLALNRQADALAGRGVWLVIGDRDARVSTDSAIALARQVTASSLRLGRPARVDLHVIAEPKGHTVPAGYAELAAQWLRAQFP